MRHLHVKLLFLQQEVRDGHLRVQKIDGRENLVDVLTKHMTPKPFKIAVSRLGVQKPE